MGFKKEVKSGGGWKVEEVKKKMLRLVLVRGHDGPGGPSRHSVTRALLIFVSPGEMQTFS